MRGPQISDRWISSSDLRGGWTRMAGKRKRCAAKFKSRVAVRVLWGELHHDATSREESVTPASWPFCYRWGMLIAPLSAV